MGPLFHGKYDIFISAILEFHEVMKKKLSKSVFGGKSALLIAISLLASALSARATGDGARAYFLAPVNVSLLTGYAISIRGNQSFDIPVTIGIDANVNAQVVQLSRTMGIGSFIVAPFLVVPFGEFEGTLHSGSFAVRQKSAGLGDIQLGVAVGLFGAPPMTPAEYLKYDPGLTIGIFGKLIMPTGDYSNHRFINLGSNRWTGQIGFPITYYRGNSLFDKTLTTFELVPSVWIFGDNRNPFHANNRGQAPLLQIEGHITQNLCRMLWVSIDGFYIYGGSTSADGVSANNTQSGGSLGATIGVIPDKHLSFKFNYESILARNNNVPNGHLFKLLVTLSF